TSISSPVSTRSWRRPRCGGPSRRRCAAKASSTACSASGTARAPASTAAGTSPHGGVLALMGDDHTAESSTTAHQSEFAFVDVMMPILSPAGVQEILDYGLYGWAMSRYTGAWVGLKCMHETVESTAVVDARVDRMTPVVPVDYKLPPG